MHRAFYCAQSFFQCRAQAQSFFLCAELFPVHGAFSSAVHRHRAFCRAQSFLPYTELSAVHRAFCRAQSFFQCTELFPVHRAFSCAQSFFQCTGTELWGPKPVIPTNAFAAGNSCFTNSRVQKLKNSSFAEFWDSTPEFYGGILYWLLEKQGKLYFLQSSQTKGRGETNFFDA